MAELSVKIEYASKARQAALQAMRMAFPLWGIVPILMIIGIAGSVSLKWLTLGNSGGSANAFMLVANVVFCAAFIVLTCLLSIRVLEKSKLLIDKNGIELLFELSFTDASLHYLPWKDVIKVMVASEGHDSNWQKKQLVLFLPDSKTCTIKLGRIDPAELEQLLVSIDVFAPQAEQDSSVSNLKDELKQVIRQGQNKLLGPADGVTYTELWEEELSRRFRAAAFMPLEVGIIMRGGSLTLVRHLALGGLSAVYLAQLGGGKLVTLKESVVPEDVDTELKEKAREMFAREATLLMRLSHPNIVQVLDYFVEQGRSYLMLDYMSGQDLRQFVRQNGAVRESLAVDWACQIARVMDYLHSQAPPIIHRDLTPDNLIVRGDGQIVVIDFGAANEFLGNATGTFVGKQSYIAPEQFRGKATTQSDIYAFGGTLYYLLTGSDPEALAQSEPDKVKENISSDLAQLVKSCTALEAQERPQSASEIVRQLELMSMATNQGGPVHNDA
jgi:tRNA A-37 threonylcarbamoyl transferase component Bud32